MVSPAQEGVTQGDPERKLRLADVEFRPEQTADDVFLAPDGNLQQTLEKFGFEPGDDWEGAEDIEDRRMMLNDDDGAVLPEFAFAHVAVAIPQAGEPLGAFAGGFTADALVVVDGEFLIDDEQELFGRGGTEELLRGLEQIERERITRGGEEFVGALSEPVELEGTAARLRLAPGVEQARALHLVAQFLHAHVGHFQTVGEITGMQALSALEFVENFQAGTASDGFEKALFQMTNGLEVSTMYWNHGEHGGHGEKAIQRLGF